MSRLAHHDASHQARAPGCGQGIHVIDPSEQGPDVLERLREAFRSPSYEPPILPAAALQLFEITRRADAGYRDVLLLMEADPMIAGKVLRIAQSPIYGRGEPVRTLEQALTRLGMGTLGQIFLQVTMTARIFRARGYEGPMEALRCRAVAVAHAARIICRQTALSDELAFICGLLHDIGAVASLIVLADVRHPAKPPAFQSIIEDVAAARTEASGTLCELWRLPHEVVTVVMSYQFPVIRGVAHPLACVVNLADELATERGFETPFETRHVHDLAVEALGITGPVWRRTKAEFGGMADRLR